MEAKQNCSVNCHKEVYSSWSLFLTKIINWVRSPYSYKTQEIFFFQKYNICYLSKRDMLIQASRGACAKMFLHLHFVIWQPRYQKSDGFGKQVFDATQCRHRASLVAQWWRIYLQCRRLQFNSWVRKIPWRRYRLPTPAFLGFLCGSAGKESSSNAGDLPGFYPWVGKIPWRRERLPSPVFWPGEFIPWTV